MLASGRTSFYAADGKVDTLLERAGEVVAGRARQSRGRSPSRACKRAQQEDRAATTARQPVGSRRRRALRLEFHSKMNSIDDDIIDDDAQGGSTSRRSRLPRPGHRQRRRQLLGRRQHRDAARGPSRKRQWDDGEAAGQALPGRRTSACATAHVPVVTAPYGLTLGGGAR